MALTPSAARYVRRKLPDSATDSALARAASDLMAECDAVLKRVRAATARIKERTPRAPGPSREERRKERSERMAHIRRDVFMESQAMCASCACEITEETFHAHHLVSGGARRAEESQQTVAPVCGFCHRRAHDGHRPTMIALGAWCLRTGRKVGYEAIRRRLDKPQVSP